MRILDLAAGPGVGRALRRLEEQQQEGVISNRREALRFLRQLADKGEGTAVRRRL